MKRHWMDSGNTSVGSVGVQMPRRTEKFSASQKEEVVVELTNQMLVTIF